MFGYMNIYHSFIC